MDVALSHHLARLLQILIWSYAGFLQQSWADDTAMKPTTRCEKLQLQSDNREFWNAAGGKDAQERSPFVNLEFELIGGCLWPAAWNLQAEAPQSQMV